MVGSCTTLMSIFTLALAAAQSFYAFSSFGFRKQAWYYRCLGLDPSKQKKQGTEKRNRFLITVNVVGSAGPLRFVVKEDDPVAGVIDSALKAYARGGRVPVLGSDVKNFMLYCANGTSEALSPQEAIGSRGARKFVLCQKPLQPQMTEGRSELMRRKASGWKAWLSKSFSFSL